MTRRDKFPTEDEELVALANDMLGAAKGRKMQDVTVACLIIVSQNIAGFAHDWFDAMEGAVYATGTLLKLTGAHWFVAHDGVRRKPETRQ